MSQPLPVYRRIELAEAVIELATAQAKVAKAAKDRGSFDAIVRYDKLHAQIDIMLNELEWLRAIEATFGQEPA